MRIDAIVLAGGRSSRLGGVPKAQLKYEERTLLERTVAIAANPVAHTSHVVVVGDVEAGILPAGVVVTREDPPFGGPAAGIAAGVTALATSDPSDSRADPDAAFDVSDFTLVLACDMPRVEAAVSTLLTALTQASDDHERLHESGDRMDGVIAVDPEQNRQPLAAIYNTSRLAEALEARRLAGQLEGLSAFALISDFSLVPVFVPAGSTDDIDTWADAEKFGMRAEPAQ